MIHGDHTENGSVFNGKVSVKNGRPMRVFNFKLTPAVLDMRVCKPEGGRRYVITVPSLSEGILVNPQDC